MHLPLHPHPSTPASTPLEMWVRAERSAAFGESATINLCFGVVAPAHRFVLPQGEPIRTDGLWRTTCCEAFLQDDGGTAYREWNFGPGGAWAAYDFSGYRADMRDALVAAEPYIRLEDNLTWWTLAATLAVPSDAQYRLGLSAVLEEQDGTKSFWALAHGGEKPDFHNPDCFTARLP